VITKKVVTYGDKPLSAAHISERVDALFVKFRQQLDAMVDSLGDAGVSAASFAEFTSSLRVASAAASLEALVTVMEAADPITPSIDHEGRTLRFRGVSTKQWLTPFGLATDGRGYCASDEGASGAVPLDAMLGMTGRYMTPEVEEMVAFACSAMTPCEGEQITSKALPDAPSSTAIKRTIRDVGGFFEENKAAVEKRLASEKPLSEEGSNLVVSWDGVMVPIRGVGETVWKEAGVGRVSVYGEPGSEDGHPPMIDSRYFARMPESGMTTLIDEVAACVSDTCSRQSFNHVAVICDGKDSIWNSAANRPELDGAVFILDFYHASESLSDVATAIFGEGTEEADRWFRRRRERLLLDDDAVDKLLRTLRRYATILPADSNEHDVVRRAIKHFRKNRRRMRYATFIAMGLPIGSGHVESAAKDIVAHRLKRSGMRWSRTGGQRVLNIRTRVKDGRWDAAWSAYIDSRAAA